MDWLDTYLDGLAQYKTTVSPCDTHIWGEKPNLNNQQKRMLFDAAAQSELEYRLIVQEARQAEINAGMGGSYDAGSAARERPATPAAPSGFGLPSSITIAGAVGGSIAVNGTYSKTNQAIGYLAASTNGSFNYYNASTGVYVTSPDNTNSNGDYNYEGWVIASSADGAYYFMTNPSTDKFNFPTTGWVYTIVFAGSNNAGQSGPASLTITAA